jgi:hypothetical protein
MRILVIVLATALAFSVTAVLYFTGPTTKTVTRRVHEDAQCWSFHYEGQWENGHLKDRRVCDETVPAGWHNNRHSVRTTAWERISGALTGSGDLDS